ncbi:MAG TPA: LacI family DNA-binding transcriptional regulator [Caulobacteraceae bacterium]|jgi:LacI family transcriptional regulator
MSSAPPRAGVRPVTIRDVAREAGVSVASASRSLNGLANVTQTTRERVLLAASKLRYVPHTAARALSTRRSDTIGVMLPDLHGEFFSEIIRGADLAARALGLHLLVSTSHGDAAEAAAAMRSMRGRVDGLLLMSPYVDEQALAENLADDLPTVLINTRVEGRPYASFFVDNHGGALAATRHLASLGAAVAHIAGPADNYDSQERLRGYRDAMGGAKGLVLQGDFTEESGWRAGQELARMRPRPTAVFAANDMMAIGCLQALEEEGVRVPHDMTVAGFDDIPVARLIRPSLTTVRISIAELGRRALERLAAAIAGEKPSKDLLEIVRTELVVRGSSALSVGAARTLAERTGEKRQ